MTAICGVALIPRHCGVRKWSPHSSGSRAPCIWPSFGPRNPEGQASRCSFCQFLRRIVDARTRFYKTGIETGAPTARKPQSLARTPSCPSRRRGIFFRQKGTFFHLLRAGRRPAHPFRPCPVSLSTPSPRTNLPPCRRRLARAGHGMWLAPFNCKDCFAFSIKPF